MLTHQDLLHDVDILLSNQQTFVTTTQPISVDSPLYPEHIVIYLGDHYNNSNSPIIFNAIQVVVRIKETKQIIANKIFGSLGTSIKLDYNNILPNKISLVIDGSSITCNYIDLNNKSLQVEFYSLCAPAPICCDSLPSTFNLAAVLDTIDLRFYNCCGNIGGSTTPPPTTTRPPSESNICWSEGARRDGAVQGGPGGGEAIQFLPAYNAFIDDNSSSIYGLDGKHNDYWPNFYKCRADTSSKGEDAPPNDLNYTVGGWWEGVRTFTFSQSVKDPCIAIYNLGARSNTITLTSSVDCSLGCLPLSMGNRHIIDGDLWPGNAPSLRLIGRRDIIGNHSYGIVKFPGLHSAISLTSTYSCPNLVTNGDFEDNNAKLTNDNNPNLFGRWKAFTVDRTQLSEFILPKVDGNKNWWVDLNACGVGYIEQSIPTNPAEVYTVFYRLSANSANKYGPIRTGTISARQHGSTFLIKSEDFMFDVTNITYNIYSLTGDSDMGWINKSFTFQAQSAYTTLKFASTSLPSCYGPAIDDVVVVPAECSNPEAFYGAIRWGAECV